MMPRAMGVREGQKVFKVMIGGWGGSGWDGGWLFAGVAHNWAKTMHKCISHYGLLTSIVGAFRYTKVIIMT